MFETKFVRKNKPIWERLEKIASGRLLKDCGQIAEFDRLYRITCTHLSYAQTNYPDSDVCAYLSQLTVKAHNRFYPEKPGRFVSPLRFIFGEIPASLHRNGAFIAVAGGLLILSVIYAFIYTYYIPEAAEAFLGDLAGRIDYGGSGPSDWDSLVMSGVILSNNVRVCYMSFALGLTAGLGTLYVTVTNGGLLGSLSALMTLYSDPLTFWSLILPHGIIELFAITLGSAAGFKLGFSLLRPGKRKRVHALRLAAVDSLILLGLASALLIIAAVIEGYFTPSAVAAEWKLAFSALTAVLLAAYWLPGIRASKNTDKP